MFNKVFIEFKDTATNAPIWVDVLSVVAVGANIGGAHPISIIYTDGNKVFNVESSVEDIIKKICEENK